LQPEPGSAAPPADSGVEFDKGARSFDPGRVLKSGATLVRQWRGHTHTVLVQEDGFEYDGQRYHQGSGPILVPFGEFSNVRFHRRQVRFARDSPLEEAGFEPSVPGSRERGPPIVREQVANRFPGS
jgi:hypothetical protein